MVIGGPRQWRNFFAEAFSSPERLPKRPFVLRRGHSYLPRQRFTSQHCCLIRSPQSWAPQARSEVWYSYNSPTGHRHTWYLSQPSQQLVVEKKSAMWRYFSTWQIVMCRKSPLDKLLVAEMSPYGKCGDKSVIWRNFSTSEMWRQSVLS